jgi:hypothetical protein
VKFASGSVARSTLADTRYVFHVHGSFATGIVSCSLVTRRHARPTAFATAPSHRPSQAPINCAAVGAAGLSARSRRAPFACIQMYPSGSSLRWTHRKLITRWPESRRALLASGEHDMAVGARRIAVCLCQAPPRRARTSALCHDCECETSRRVALSRAEATRRLSRRRRRTWAAETLLNLQ